MATYLLLRDNKESGPFTMDELLNFGLKPYDLVWVQGKSAAWRYSSEIEELKPFAPVIEEQPFDRFYKKNTEEKKEEPAIANEQLKYAPVAKTEEEKFVPKKSVFVTLPDQKQVVVQRPVQPQPETPVAAPVISITENPAIAEIKYSQPLDEIKEMYVKTLQDRKTKMAKKGLWMDWIKKAAVFGGLIIVGVLAGFIIRSKSGKEDKTSLQMLQASPALLTSKDVKEALPDTQQQLLSSENEPLPQTKQDDPALATENNKLVNTTEKEPPTLRIRKETMVIVPKQKESFDTRPVPSASEMNPISGERNRKIRTGNPEESAVVTAKNTTVINSLQDQVSVTSNDYKRVAFGGIRDLYLTVTNNSKFELDKVVVELQYLKPSEEPLRTEHINFKSIIPNGSATMRIPDTNRGNKSIV